MLADLRSGNILSVAAMASGNDLMEKLQDEVSCSICLEYLRDPVTIDCGHNFCCMCITDYCERWEGSTAGVFLCPQCRAGFLQSTFRPNTQLANIVEGIEQLALQPDKEPKEKVCEKHGKKLRLFCEDDGEAICLVCDKSREHRSHTVIPIEEAAQDYKVGASNYPEPSEGPGLLGAWAVAPAWGFSQGRCWGSTCSHGGVLHPLSARGYPRGGGEGLSPQHRAEGARAYQAATPPSAGAGWAPSPRACDQTDG